MMLLRLAYAFVLTVLIECGVLWGLDEKRKSIIRLSIQLNALTNIPLNLLDIYCGLGFRQILVAEICIVLIEACGYSLVMNNSRSSLVYSFLCNAMSFSLGVLLEFIHLFWLIRS